MSAIGAIKDAAAIKVQGRRTVRNVQDTVKKIMQLHFDENMVESKACIFLDKTWGKCQALDPATAPSDQVFISTYKNWVGAHEGGAKHLSHFMPTHLTRQLGGLRCGRHPLHVHRMRFLMVFPGGQRHVECVARRGWWRISCTLCCIVSTMLP